MNFSKYIIGFAVAISLAACGGGGGSASGSLGGTGTTGTETTGATTTVIVPAAALNLELLDSAGLPTSFVSASDVVFVKATLKNAIGAVLANAKVTFSGDVALVTISPATTVLTNAFGVATVQISASSLSAAGAGTLSAYGTIDEKAVTSNINFQLSPANLTLSTLNVGSGSLAAYGNRPVSVLANINGALATRTPVKVNFSATCGTLSPSTATTDGTGKASTTYTADSASCAGTNVKIVANSVGVATPLEGSITVGAVQATNLQFIEAKPRLIYLLGSGAVTQSLVSFKVVDSSNNPVQNQNVNLALLNANPAAGLSIDTLGNSAGLVKTTDASGVVTVAVYSGDVPTSVQVTAKLDAPSTVQTNSNVLTVASGKPTQKSASLSLESFSIEAFNMDGIKSGVTLRMADRQGNPVPIGTEVNFVTESGLMSPARCVVLDESSSCTSTYYSSGTRPADGRVSILAYVPGEEDFLDLNFNNRYDIGEPFTDMGNAYRDDNDDSVFTVGEFSVPRAGDLACSLNGIYQREGTCDGKWGINEVRKQAIIVLATGEAIITPVFTTANNFVFKVTDMNGNSLPTGTTFAAEKKFGSDSCAVKTPIPALLPNVYGAANVSVDLIKCVAGDQVRVTVTSPKGIITSQSISVTP